MSVQSHKDLEVWQKAVGFVTTIYALTEAFPKQETYGLTNQIRRAAVSIPSNIAEGRSKRSTKEFIRYINIAYGSAAEVETQLIISQNLGYVTAAQLEKPMAELDVVSRMLNKLYSALEGKL